MESSTLHKIVCQVARLLFFGTLVVLLFGAGNGLGFLFKSVCLLEQETSSILVLQDMSHCVDDSPRVCGSNLGNSMFREYRRAKLESLSATYSRVPKWLHRIVFENPREMELRMARVSDFLSGRTVFDGTKNSLFAGKKIFSERSGQ